MIQQENKNEKVELNGKLFEPAINDATPPEIKADDKKDENENVKVYASIDDFLKIEIKIGEVKEVNEVEGSDKLYKLKVDFGTDDIRTVFSGIKKFVSIEDLLGKQFPFVTNLAPRKMMGEYSEAMILAGNDADNFALLNPSNKLQNGTKLK
jgi:methionyl-tRNA synthetase